MIGLESELLIKTGLIMEKKIMKRIYLAGRPMVSRRFDKKLEKEGATPKEQRGGIGSGIW